MNRKLVQRGVGRPASFTKEVALGRHLKETNTRRAIRWFGKLRKILLDPSLAEPGDGDLFNHATGIDWQNHRRMTGPPPRNAPDPRLSKKQRRRDWEETLDP